MRQLLDADSEGSPNDAIRAVADTRAEILEKAQSKNTIKERLIVAAIAFEFLAVVVVGVAIVEVLNPGF